MELIITLGIMSWAIMGATALIDRYNADTQAVVAAQQMKTVGDAATAYIKDNWAVVAAAATSTTPVLITVGALSTTGYLTTGFQAINGYGQSVCVLVLKPTATQLNAMVVSEQGTAIDDITLGTVAGAIGAAGGGIYSSAATTLQGAVGGWSSPVGNFASANVSGTHCDGVTPGAVALTAGHPVVALWFNNGDSTSGFLYRNQVAGQPQLNTMNTPILMASVQVSGGACATTGAIAQDGTGKILSCQGGTWKGGSAGGLTWKGSVANYASLPGSPTGGDTYRITGLASHAFTWDSNNNLWQGLDVDSSGNLTLSGVIYASGSNTSYGAITMQGSKNGWSGINFKDVNGNNSGTLMMHPSYSGFFSAADNAWRWYVDNSGNSFQPGNAEAGTLQVDTAVAEGSGCSPDGKIAKSSATSGLILSCQSGVWKKAQGSGGTGMSGILMPLVGKTISCSFASGMGIGYAWVDASGNPYTRSYFAGADSGWVPGFSATNVMGYVASWTAGTYPSLQVNTPAIACTANWPAT